MMTVEQIMQIASNLATPVACLAAMFWLWNKEVESHKEETSKLITALENNTLVMQQIRDKLGGC